MARIKWFLPRSDEAFQPFGIDRERRTQRNALPSSAWLVLQREPSAGDRSVAAASCLPRLTTSSRGPAVIGPLSMPAGTEVTLAAEDCTLGNGDPLDSHLVVVVASTGPVIDGWTWLVAHRPTCAYAANPHPPCLELRVRNCALVPYGALG